MTFRMALDSSILISHLVGDVHKEAVLAAITHADILEAELILPLLCYAEIWTGTELLDEGQQQQAADALHNILQASRLLLVADNVAIAREAARG